MSRIEITADRRELENMARALGAKRLERAARRGVTAAGSAARKELPALLAAVYQTSRAGLEPRGKAPQPGAALDRIAYRLAMRRRIKLEKLRSGARTFKRRRRDPLGKLRIKQPQPSGEPGVDVFAVRKGDGRTEFVLPRRGGLRSRRVGGPIVSLHRNPAVRSRVDRIGRDAVEAMVEAMEAALKGRAR